MKKLSILLVLFLIINMAGCGDNDRPGEPLRVASLKGPTSMGLVNLMAENEGDAEKKRYDFTIVTAADELTTSLIQGELDCAVIPANLAAILYNKTEGKIKVAALAVGGVLHLVAKGTPLTSLQDLKGQTLMSTGKGTVPEYILTHLLQESGLGTDDLTIEWKAEPTEVVAHLKLAEKAMAMMPEPFLTVAEGQVEGLQVLPLDDIWKTVHPGSSQVTAVVVVRSEVLDKRAGEVKKFLADFKQSVDKANSDMEVTATLIETYGIVKADVARKALPRCNVMLVTGPEMKDSLSAFLGVLHAADAAAVGGTLPGDDFYAISAAD